MPSAKDFLNRLTGSSEDKRGLTIADLPNSNDRSLSSFLGSVKRWIERAGKDMPTWERLRNAGVVRSDETTGEFISVSGRPDYTSPPAPTGLTASGAMTSILLEWDAIPYNKHAYTELWSNSVDNLGTALHVSSWPGVVGTDSVGTGQTRYYWVRFVSTSNVKGPFNATAGVVGVTSNDPAFTLSILAGQLTTSQLAAALNTRINLIDAGIGTSGSVDARIKVETDARVTADGLLTTQISALAVSSDAGFDFAKIYYFDTTVEGWTGNGTPTVSAGWLRAAAQGSDPYVISPSSLAIDAASYPQIKARIQKVGTPTWDGRLYYQRTIDSTWDTARSVVISEPTYTSGIASVTWDMSATWSGTIDKIRIDLTTSSDGSNYIEFDWIALGRAAPGASTAQIVNIETAQIGYCTLAGVPTDHTNKTACNAAGGTWNVGIPMATAVKQVAVNDGSTTTALEQRFVAQKNLDNTLSAQYTVKVQAGGYVSGIGLATTTVNSAPYSEFAIVADQFSIAPVNTDNTAADGSPFFYRTSSTTINGVSIPAGAYMKSAYIHDASITNAKIQNLAVDDAKISAVTAGKISAGTISASYVYVGDSSFAFDAPNRILRITDTQASPKTRVTLGKIGATSQDYGLAIYNPDGTVLLSTGRAFDSSVVNAQNIQGNTGLFAESWENPDVLNHWEVKQGPGELSIQSVADSVSGGKVLRIGNNAGNDESWLVYKFNIPFDSTKLYKVKVRVRRTMGSGTLYCGFTGVAANGTTIVDWSGGSSYSAVNWHVANASNPASSWTEYEGYTRGFGAPNGTYAAGSISTPGLMHSSVRYIRPTILCNYSGATGTFEVDSISVEEVPNAVDWTGNVANKPANIAALSGSEMINNSLMDSLSLIATGNCVIEGNQVYKNGGATAYDSGVQSVESYPSAFVSFLVGEMTTYRVVGLSVNPGAAPSEASIDYGIHIKGPEGIFGLIVGGTSYLGNVASCASTDVLSLSYDGVNFKLYKNGSLVNSFAAAPSLNIFLDGSFRDPGARIKNLRFGPLSSQNWNNIGGLLRPQDNATATSAQNLVFNGAAEFGDNRNFPSFTYDATDGASGQGCFTTTGGNLFSGEYIPVNTAQSYEISAAWKCSNTSSTQYLGYACYDSNKNPIEHSYCFFVANTRVAYYQSYSAGATIIRVVPPSGADWQNVGNTYLVPGVAADGSNLPIQTISIIGIDKSARPSYDTLTLASGIPANVTTADYVANSYEGSGYQYILSAGAAVTGANTWYSNSATMTGTNGANEPPPYNKFRRGTAFVRFLFLSNYNSVGGTTWKYDDLAFRALGTLLPTVADGTAVYRTTGAPTNNPVPTGITTTLNTNGTANIRVDWASYAQGSAQADLLMLFWRKDGTAPTLQDSAVSFNVNTAGASYYIFEGVNPADTYSFGIAAARRTEAGLVIGAIQAPSSSPDWLGVTGGAPVFSAAIDNAATIGGTAASVVVANASSGSTAATGTANYRANAEPQYNPVFGTITKSVTSDGNSVVYVPYTYTQGSPIADQLFIFVREGGGTVVAADPAMATNAITGEMKFTLKPSTTYTFGLQAVRRTESGLVGKVILTSPSIVTDAANFTGNINSTAAATVVSNASNGNSAWGKFSGTGSTLPSGNVEFSYALGSTKGGNAANTDQVGTQSAATVQAATINFNNRNDRNGAAITAPTIAADNTAVDHTLNTDGSADISFEWAWGGTAIDIDGFIAYVRQAGSSAAYTFGATPAEEQVFYLTPEKRAFIFYGVAADKYYHFGIQAYRIVDADVNAAGVIKSTLVKPSLSNENPYQPASNVTFGGNVTGTINGSPISSYANSNVTIGSNGSLSGGGGGQVTMGGLGYTGALNADKTQVAVEGVVSVGDLGAIRNSAWPTTKKISIDFANQQIALGSDTWGDANPKILHQYNGGTPRSYIGNGGDKFIMFDGTDFFLGRDVQMYGADAFKNKSHYSSGVVAKGSIIELKSAVAYVTESDGLIKWDIQTSGSAAIYAIKQATLSRFNFGTSGSKKRRVKVRIKIVLPVGAGSYLLVGSGVPVEATASSTFIGVKILPDGSVTAVSDNGNARTSSSSFNPGLGSSVEGGDLFEFELSSGLFRCWVNGVGPYQTASNIPSGEGVVIQGTAKAADSFLTLYYSSVNSVQKIYYIGEYRVEHDDTSSIYAP